MLKLIFRVTIEREYVFRIGMQNIFTVFRQLSVCTFMRAFNQNEHLFFPLKWSPITNINSVFTLQVFDNSSEMVIKLINKLGLNNIANEQGKCVFILKV